MAMAWVLAGVCTVVGLVVWWLYAQYKRRKACEHQEREWQRSEVLRAQVLVQLNALDNVRHLMRDFVDAERLIDAEEARHGRQ
jgi:hypothetical protein